MFQQVGVTDDGETSDDVWLRGDGAEELEVAEVRTPDASASACLPTTPVTLTEYV